MKGFMKAGQMTPIDTYSLVHGEFCKIFEGIPLSMDSLTRKRKIYLGEDTEEPECKKVKGESCLYNMHQGCQLCEEQSQKPNCVSIE